MIKIGNKYHGDKGEYIGRGSPLGNPFLVVNKEDREDVYNKYEIWLEQNENNIEIKNELIRLAQIYRDNGNELTLVCFCAPKRCHGETIKKYVQKYIDYLNDLDIRIKNEENNLKHNMLGDGE